MSDIRLFYSQELISADMLLAGADLSRDDGLETAIVVSLFTDRRAKPDDELPAGAGNDRRGWWGDAFPPAAAADAPGWRLGSRLWLLSREKQLPAVVAKARDYVREALNWLIEDGIAERMDIEAEIFAPGVLAYRVIVYRPEGTRVEFRYSHEWEAQRAWRSAS